MGREISGYGGKVAPPFSRFYMGGENDIRGFDIWGISPIVFLPTESSVNVYNADGTQRMQKQIINGVTQFSPVTMTDSDLSAHIPGRRHQLGRKLGVPHSIFGPIMLAIFGDAGIDKLALPNQLKLNPGRVDQLNAEFPRRISADEAYIAPGTQKMRASTGLELQVLMPVVNAPFRVYFAYNPSRFDGNLQPPIVADKSYFPNSATYNNALTALGTALPFDERRTTFRFSIGRTFEPCRMWIEYR